MCLAGPMRRFWFVDQTVNDVSSQTFLLDAFQTRSGLGLTLIGVHFLEKLPSALFPERLLISS